MLSLYFFDTYFRDRPACDYANLSNSLNIIRRATISLSCCRSIRTLYEYLLSIGTRHAPLYLDADDHGTSSYTRQLRNHETDTDEADAEFTMQWLKTFAGYLAPLFLIMSPLLSYTDQVLSMHRNKSSAGFSLDIPLIMLVASLLRYIFGRMPLCSPFSDTG